MLKIYMRKYVIFTPCIINMGGAQMYVRNKCIHMHEQGWDVDIITSQYGVIYIHDLKKYDYVIPELGFNYFLFSKTKRERIIQDILKRLQCDRYDEIVIESTCISESTWAEVVAERIGGRHLFYNLQEHNNISSKVVQAFLIFKYLRHELVGIVEKSLYNMFLPFRPINKDASYSLPACCNNVVEDIESPLLEQIKNYHRDYIVGCLSRLDKPFVIPALKDFISYVTLHPEKQYLLLMIGGAPEKSTYVSDIRKLFIDVKNVNLIITGYLFPVPLKLFELCDAFFTSAGSTRVCMRSGVPSISYDANDFRPIGILGRTTKNTLLRGDNEHPIELSELLDDILVNKKYLKEASIYHLYKVDFSLHDKFLAQMSPTKEYFDFENVQKDGAERKLSFLLNMVGAENYYKLGEIKKRVLKQ